MKRWVAFVVLFGAACEEGPRPETLIEDVQVVAAVADPPAVAEGEPWTLTTTVADPRERGAEVLIWSCEDEDCTTARSELVGEEAGFEMVSDAALPVWVLACDPGTCELDDPDPADLADPFGWMQRLPVRGVSLATREVVLTDAPVEERPTNPLLVSVPADGRLAGMAAGDRRKLAFEVPGATTAWGYSTGGGFARPSEDVASDGTVALTWYAPDEPGPVRLYAVFEGEGGGTAVWRAEVEVGD